MHAAISKETGEYAVVDWYSDAYAVVDWERGAVLQKREGKISLALEIMSPKRKETQRKTGQEKKEGGEKEGKIRRQK